MSITDFLQSLEACPEAVAWASDFRELEELWHSCPHAEWMIWALEEVGYDNETNLRLFATSCARHHWHLLTDPRSRRAVEIAERFARRAAHAEELRQAREDGRAATLAGAWPTSWTAAAAAAATTAYATTLSSGFAAARDASKHAVRAGGWDMLTYVTTDEEDAWQAEQLRRLAGPELPQILALARRKIESIEESRSGLPANGRTDCGCSGDPSGAATNGRK
jgi:hypothetical protein